MAFNQRHQDLWPAHIDVESSSSGDDFLISGNHRKRPRAIMRDIKTRLALKQV